MSDATPTLEQLGWDRARAKAFKEYRAKGWQPARVAIEDKHNYVVLNAGGPLPVHIAGKIMHRSASKAALPKVGDWVAISVLEEEGKGVIHQVLPRRSAVSRKTAGREVEEQVLAANVDKAFVVQALDQTFNPRLMERHLLMSHEGGVRPVVVLNKADLCKDVPAVMEQAKLCAGGAEILVVSALTGEHINDLGGHVHPGETVVFIGSSGVGKSSLINRLYGEEIQPTIEVRESDSKGRHATTWRELILLPKGGLVIDTPGMREFHLWFGNEGVQDAYPELHALAPQCRFRDCAHLVEQGCAVIASVAAGQLSSERYQGYVKLRRELDFLEAAQGYGHRPERQRRAKTGNRAQKKYQHEFGED